MLTSSDFPEAAYAGIAATLQQQQNFDLYSYKPLSMKRRLAAHLRSVGCLDPELYSAQLEESPFEQKRLIAALGIQVSQFFRNPTTFVALQLRILPDLLGAARRQKSRLRVWSVGCAHGEEPYSVALLLNTLRRDTDACSILATDLSSAALKIAKQGDYRADRIKDVPPELLRNYFEQRGEFYRIRPEVRRQVQFFRHDIVAEQSFYRADLILCRNLLIYFSRQKQQQIIELLAKALLPGGYLVLGRAETMAPDCRGLFHCTDPAERIYRRVET